MVVTLSLHFSFMLPTLPSNSVFSPRNGQPGVPQVSSFSRSACPV